MRLIDLDELMKYPIRLDYYDKENSNKHYVFGVENVLKYAEYLPIQAVYDCYEIMKSAPTVEAIPIEWIFDYIEQHSASATASEMLHTWRLAKGKEE